MQPEETLEYTTAINKQLNLRRKGKSLYFRWVSAYFRLKTEF
jgi:hypothetical protein